MCVLEAGLGRTTSVPVPYSLCLCSEESCLLVCLRGRGAARGLRNPLPTQLSSVASREGKLNTEMASGALLDLRQ